MFAMLRPKFQVRLPRRGSIIRFILIWVGTIISACIFLSAALLVITMQFRDLTAQEFTLFKAMDNAHSLEIAIVREDRDFLRWSNTKKDVDKSAVLDDLQRARKYIDQLDITAGIIEEEMLIDKIEDALFKLTYPFGEETVISPEKHQILNNSALAALENYRSFNESRVSDIMRRIEGFQTTIYRWLLILILSVIVIIGVGSVVLTQRIIRPTLDLSSAAARFGQGDLTARAIVRNRDELGNLSQTFNNMAEDIHRRETSRLEFIAAVFHDIRNPLTVIGASINLLKKKHFPPEQLAEWLERISKEVNRLEDLSQDLMDTVQVESGQLSLQMEEIDFGKLMEAVCKEESEAITHHIIHCEACGNCHILGDKKRLERVMINLLSNSIKYSPEGTAITLKTEQTDSHVIFSISDQGVGIAPEEIPLLFEAFGRLPRTRDMARGTGLGLFIVKKIIEAHQGTIRIKSAVNAGTTVEVTLPSV
jgi:two-component system, OmpR family, sensor histidine kinase BaeS